MSRVLGVIPARYASTRFPGKPLAAIHGREMLAWVIDGVKTSKKLSEIIVATDHEKIFALAKKCGVQAVMTDSELPSGTDRIWAAVQGQKSDIVINIQGDEPLIKGSMIDKAIEPLLADRKLEMTSLGHPLQQDEIFSKNAVKVLVNQQGDAVYFSRFPIPFSRQEPVANAKSASVLKHIGLYGYQTAFLGRFCEAPQCEMELSESLEQLRALWLGARIRIVPVNERLWGVDTPEDIAKIEEILGAHK